MESTPFVRLVLSISLVIIFLGNASLRAQSDPGIRDTVRVDSIAVFNTENNASIPVWFFNDEELSGIEVTIHSSSPLLSIDSFTFNQQRISTSFRGLSFNADSTKASIFATDTIAAGAGMLGLLHVSFPLAQPAEVLTIDSTSYGGFPFPFHGTLFSAFSPVDSSFFEFVPEFVVGFLDLQEPPAAFDSIWLADVQTSPGQPVAVDVGYFNEEAVVDFKLALDYGDSLLQYDSLSFIGTRPMPFPVNSPLVQNQKSTHQLLLHMAFDSTDALTAGSGLLARLFFTVNPGAPETSLVIDTTTFAGVVSTAVQRVSGAVFTPFFTGSTVDIKITTDVREITDETNLPGRFSLAQNYPNPFNPTTQIRFSLPRSGRVNITIYNVLGRAVRHLVDLSLPAGVHEVTFDGRSDSGSRLASGIFFYRMVTEGFTQNKKMLLLK